MSKRLAEVDIIDLDAGQWFGEPVLVSDAPRILDAQVKVSASILLISQKTLQAVGESYPVVYRNLFAAYVYQARQTYRLLSGLPTVSS